ncbi:MAG: AtpZ/AtpI family protein [Pseudomonadota bacterium]
MSSGQKPDAFSDAELEQRRRDLGDKLGHVDQAGLAGGDVNRDGAGLGQAMKLSAEFVAGVIAGGGLGWAIDHFAGIGPWGLIVGTLLGFGAGMFNMMRAAGLMKSFGQK